MFTGFPQAGIELLSELPTLDRDGFHARKELYRSALRAPLKGLVEVLGASLRERISPGIRYEPRTHGSIGPINNDLRFRRHLPPYKDHVLLRFWEGDDPATAPVLLLRLRPERVEFTAGASFGDRRAWQRAIDADGDELVRAVGALVVATGGVVDGDALVRVPSPWPHDHPHADLLRYRRLLVRWVRPLPSSAGSPGFASWCADELAHATRVHRWLVERLGERDPATA